MSYPEPPVANYRIPIGAVIGRACRMVLQNLLLIIRFAWAPIAFVLVIAHIVNSLPSAQVADHRYLFVAQIIASALIIVLALIISVMWFLARWFRFVMLGEHSPEFFPPRRSPFVKAAVKIGAVLFLSCTGYLFAVVLFALIPLNLRFASDILFLILLFGVPFFLIEVSLMLPSAVVGRRLGLGGARALLAGNHLRLFAAMLAAFVPFPIVQIAVATIYWREFLVHGLKRKVQASG
jgi:hypothetical protein